MSLPSINFLHLTVSEIQPGHTFSRCLPDSPPAHSDTMGENNTQTALKGCGVKIILRVFSSLVLLALVDTDYRLLWVDVWSRGSSSDAQIFNCSKLKKKIEDGTLRLPTPEPLGEGGAKFELPFVGSRHLHLDAMTC